MHRWQIRYNGVSATYCIGSGMINLRSEYRVRCRVRVNVNDQLLMDVIVPEVGFVKLGPIDLHPEDLAIKVLQEDKPEPPPPPQWATVGDIIDELLKYDREKRFQIRDWPRYCDDLEEIWVQPGDLDFRETDDAVVWDVWGML